jgi:hypothetical protein
LKKNYFNAYSGKVEWRWHHLSNGTERRSLCGGRTAQCG